MPEALSPPLPELCPLIHPANEYTKSLQALPRLRPFSIPVKVPKRLPSSGSFLYLISTRPKHTFLQRPMSIRHVNIRYTLLQPEYLYVYHKASENLQQAADIVICALESVGGYSSLPPPIEVGRSIVSLLSRADFKPLAISTKSPPSILNNNVGTICIKHAD